MESFWFILISFVEYLHDLLLLLLWGLGSTALKCLLNQAHYLVLLHWISLPLSHHWWHLPLLAWIRQKLGITKITKSMLLHCLWVLLTLVLALLLLLLHHHHVLLVILHLLLILLLCKFGISHLVLRHHDHLLGIHWSMHHLLLVRHVLMHWHRVDSIIWRIHHTWHVWHAWLHVLIVGIFLILILLLLESWVTLLLVWHRHRPVLH